MMINIERLRKDLIEYLEDEALMMPESLVLLVDVENGDGRELLNIADELRFNIKDYDE